MALKPSAYQQAVLDFVQHGTGNAIVDAVAGSGKTSTLVMAAQHVQDGIFLAFNKSIATELAKRLPTSVQAKTFHSLCYGVLNQEMQRRTRTRTQLFKATSGFKVSNQFEATYGNDPELVSVKIAVSKVIGLCKANLMHPDVSTDSDIMELVDTHGIDWSTNHTNDDIIAMVRSVLRDGLNDWKSFDFDDYLYMTYWFELPLPRFTWVMVDEAQDTNLAQRAIVRRIMKRDARVLFVGDERQAIYGFRGADSNSMANIAQDFVCKRLPLSISYRCPINVVKHAQTIVSHIEYSPSAIEGMVRTVDEWNATDFENTDLVMCRNTAPLVTLAYKLIGQRIGCKIMGREIGQALVTLVKKIAGKRGTLDNLPELLDVYQEREVSKALAAKREQQAQNITDRCAAINAVLNGMTNDEIARGIAGLCDAINGLFANPGDSNARGLLTLATVHKAKGLEAPRAFILDPSLMPSKYAVQAWQQLQESNLQYVAITRAMQELVYVDSAVIE